MRQPLRVLMPLLLFVALPLLAQPIRGGNVVRVQAAGDLLAQLESLGRSGWVGWTMPVENPESRISCHWDEDSISISRDYGTDNAMTILVRAEEGRIARVKLASSSCVFDADGTTVHWIDGVDVRASARALAAIVERGSDRARKHAVMALALHEGTTDELIAIARNHPSSSTRGNALFWLGNRAGAKAAGALRDAVDNDPEADVKAKAVFGISQLPNDQSIPLLSELMRTHRNAQVRKKAAFWLGQKNDPRALKELERVLTQ